MGFRWILEKSDQIRMELLATSRAVTVIIQAAILGAALFFAMRIFGRWPAFIGFLLINFDPFYFAKFEDSAARWRIGCQVNPICYCFYRLFTN